jgi:hypothetical protein
MSTKIPLMQVIGELIDSQDRSEHYFRRLYRIGVQACRKFNMDIYGQFRSVLLDVSANGIVSWPCDYLDYSTLGVINNQGEVVPLKHNQDLSLLRQQYLASQQQIVQVPKIPQGIVGGVENPQGFPFYWLNYEWGDCGYIHLYGLGGGAATVGEFEVDPNNKCFYVAPNYPYSTIMLEYLSDGFEMGCNDYMVDIFAVEALKDEVRWQSMRDLNKKYSISEVREADRRRLISRRDAKVRLNKARINEMQVVYRKHQKLVAKA